MIYIFLPFFDNSQVNNHFFTPYYKEDEQNFNSCDIVEEFFLFHKIPQKVIFHNLTQ